MPVPIKILNKSSNKTCPERIVEFLKRHKNYGYTARELIKLLNANKHTVRTALRKLYKKGIIQRKLYNNEYYYYVKK